MKVISEQSRSCKSHVPVNHPLCISKKKFHLVGWTEKYVHALRVVRSEINPRYTSSSETSSSEMIAPWSRPRVCSPTRPSQSWARSSIPWNSHCLPKPSQRGHLGELSQPSPRTRERIVGKQPSKQAGLGERSWLQPQVRNSIMIFLGVLEETCELWVPGDGKMPEQLSLPSSGGGAGHITRNG